MTQHPWSRAPSCWFAEPPGPLPRSYGLPGIRDFGISVLPRTQTSVTEITVNGRSSESKAPPPLSAARYISGLHSRSNLPHLKRRGGTYFVTFRLADTLPRELLLRLRQEREGLVARAKAGNRPLTWTEQQDLFHWYSRRVDTALDSGLGQCWLKDRQVARIVASALGHFQGKRYELHAWVIMPNHVHVVVHPKENNSLSEILRSWKTFTAVQANRFLNRRGAFWQGESYDHLCRNEREREACCRYTTVNPVKAGFCKDPREWRWSSAFTGIEGDGVRRTP
jgi:REP element-mobilizing transposase RayT